MGADVPGAAVTLRVMVRPKGWNLLSPAAWRTARQMEDFYWQAGQVLNALLSVKTRWEQRERLRRVNSLIATARRARRRVLP